MYRANADRIDTIFIGSSRTARQLRPAVFDRVMADAGHPVTSFNLGIEGMRPPEDTMVLEQALANRTTPLKFLVVECNALQSIMVDEDKWTTRAIYTHDARRLGVYWRHIWSPSLDTAPGIDDYLKRVRDHSVEFVDHFRHFIWNYNRLSEGSASLTAAITGRPRKQKSIPPQPDGFYIKETDLKPLVGAEMKRYVKNLQAGKKVPPIPVLDDRPSQDDIAAKKALADRLGAKLVLVTAPFLREYSFVPESTDGILFLDFSNPNTWPDLYDPAGRLDYSHLNDAASEHYTRVIAGLIAASLAPRP